MAHFSDIRIPLSRIQPVDDISPNLKRSIIISHQKLPKDFFPQKFSLKREFSITNPRTNLLSQKIPRNFSNIESNPETSRRESMTARENRVEKEEDLILGIISASKEIKRVIRKHSVELRRKENEMMELLPKFLHKKSIQRDLELPPLLLKKGLTLAV
jgi:hypothetical protein